MIFTNVFYSFVINQYQNIINQIFLNVWQISSQQT